MNESCTRCGGTHAPHEWRTRNGIGGYCPTRLDLDPLPANAGTKHDDGKVRVELLPFESLSEIAKVLAFGAKKYADHNWRKGFAWSRLLGATLRHLFAWALGEDKDAETGLSHLAHAGCELMFLLAHELHGYGTDDRHKETQK